MTSISFEILFTYFLDRVTDFDISSYEDEIIEEVLLGYLKGAIGIPYLRAIFKDISIDEYDRVINYSLTTQAGCDDYFILSVLTSGMKIKWLEPQVSSKVNIMQLISGNKDAKFFSQSAHLSELKDMLENEKISLNKLIRDRGSIYNPYLMRKK